MKRWGIRHIRYFWNAFWFWRWWQGFGRHFWLIPNQADLDYLDSIWRGEQ
jgi:hypothetical protein